MDFGDSRQLNIHNNTRKHIDKIAGKVAIGKYYCRICDFACDKASGTDRHKRTQKHKKKTKATASRVPAS